MLGKRLAESLTVRVFLITVLILFGAGAVTFGLIAWATPSTYTAVVNDDLTRQVKALAVKLEQSSYRDCGPLLDDFIRASGAQAMLVGPDGALADTGAQLAVQPLYEDSTMVITASGNLGEADAAIARAEGTSVAGDMVSVTMSEQDTIVTEVRFSDGEDPYSLYVIPRVEAENLAVRALVQMAPWLLLTLLKIVGILLLIVLVLLALALLCPFCADFCWENGVVTIRAGVPGITLPVFRWPAPPPAGPEEPKGFFGKLKAKLRASRAERRRKKAAERAAKEAKKPKKETPPRKKAKLTLNILVTILRGAGRLTKAVFGSLRVTRIRVCLGVRGEDPAEAARAYGRLNAWLYPSLGVIDRFVYLDFEELRILPDFGSAEPTVADRVSFRLSARLLFIVAAAVRVLYEFWHEKVLDVFL